MTNWPSEPVRLGQYAIDEEEPEPRVAKPGESLCTNCLHQMVCAVALAARSLGQVAIGVCEHQLPMEELVSESPPQK
jgi:hypothetical protein